MKKKKISKKKKQSFSKANHQQFFLVRGLFLGGNPETKAGQEGKVLYYVPQSCFPGKAPSQELLSFCGSPVLPWTIWMLLLDTSLGCDTPILSEYVPFTQSLRGEENVYWVMNPLIALSFSLLHYVQLPFLLLISLNYMMFLFSHYSEKSGTVFTDVSQARVLGIQKTLDSYLLNGYVPQEIRHCTPYLSFSENYFYFYETCGFKYSVICIFYIQTMVFSSCNQAVFYLWYFCVNSEHFDKCAVICRPFPLSHIHTHLCCSGFFSVESLAYWLPFELSHRRD